MIGKLSDLSNEDGYKKGNIVNYKKYSLLKLLIQNSVEKWPLIIYQIRLINLKKGYDLFSVKKPLTLVFSELLPISISKKDIL